MTENSFLHIEDLLLNERGSELALAYVQGYATEAGTTVERRARKKKATPEQRKAVLAAALKAMRDEINAVINGLEK